MSGYRAVGLVLALGLLAGCGAGPGPAEATQAAEATSAVATDRAAERVEATQAAPSGGSIYLYGESHGVEAILERELELWGQHYDAGLRHLFVEMPYYSAQALNRWMQAEDDSLLEAYVDRQVSRDFYSDIKRQYPETVFHGVDVGLAYESLGAQYLAYLQDRGLEDTEEYRLTQASADQGRQFAQAWDTSYRETMMTESFIREFDALGGQSVAGFFGANHANPEYMEYMLAQVPSLAMALEGRYGAHVQAEDLSWMGYATEPLRIDTLTVGDKTYQAAYFGSMPLQSPQYYSREYWRLEGAFEDFAGCPAAGDVLPFDNYPMRVEEGQVFVIDYTRKNLTTERYYYRAAGGTWHGRPATEAFLAP